MSMKLVAIAKLLPTPEQSGSLLATMERINSACEWLGERAFEAQTANKFSLHHLYYHDLREQFGLSAQMAVRAISKVCEVYKRDRRKQPHFKPHGAVAYDQRIMSFKVGDTVSLLTLVGRIVVPFVAGAYHHARLEGVRGQADLVFRRNKWFLYVSVEVPSAAPVEPQGWLGVDLGIRNLATDSDGQHYTGTVVERVRQRQQLLRSTLQRVDTKSSKRHLRRLSGHEARFRSDVNHTISKCIVAKAKDTGRGIAVEDLTGIRERTTVRKGQRAMHGGWAFFQLRSFVEYKGTMAGLPVVAVDPRDTSRICPACGHNSKANRRSQSEFVCQSCGFRDHADHVGAVNIARKAAVNRPIVAGIGRETHSCESSLSLAASPSL